MTTFPRKTVFSSFPVGGTIRVRSHTGSYFGQEKNLDLRKRRIRSDTKLSSATSKLVAQGKDFPLDSEKQYQGLISE